MIFPHTKIYDVRYSYIYDFLNIIVDYKLEKNLTIEDIYKIAYEFIKNYSKKLIKK